MNGEVCDHLSQFDIEGIAKTVLAPLASEKIDCAVKVCAYEVLYLYLSLKNSEVAFCRDIPSYGK